MPTVSGSSRSDHFFGGVFHSVGDNEIQTGIAKDLLALLHIRAFKPDDNRRLDSDSFRRFDDAGCNDVAPHNSAENVNKNGLDVLVR